jgi:superfamily II DNA or RNA helicase
MGTGKTFIALWLAKELNLKLLVICPKILINIWRQEAERYGIKIVNVITYGKLASIKNKQPKHGFLIRSDENNKIRFRATEEYKKIVNQGILLIFDEFHMIKKSKVAKTEASHALIEGFTNNLIRSKYGVLSATPLENDVFIFNFLKLLGFIKNDISTKNDSKISIEEDQ